MRAGVESATSMNEGHGEQVGVPKIASLARDGHKGTFGTVVVIGGCCAGAVRMLGAPALAAVESAG